MRRKSKRKISLRNVEVKCTQSSTKYVLGINAGVHSRGDRLATFRKPSVVAGRIATCCACAQSTHRRCSSAFETCQLTPCAYSGKAQILPEYEAGPFTGPLSVPVSKPPADGVAKVHSSHPERSRCMSSWTFRMSSRYALISCRRTSDCTGGGWVRFRVLRSSKALE